MEKGLSSETLERLKDDTISNLNRLKPSHFNTDGFGERKVLNALEGRHLTNIDD